MTSTVGVVNGGVVDGSVVDGGVVDGGVVDGGVVDVGVVRHFCCLVPVLCCRSLLRM